MNTTHICKATHVFQQSLPRLHSRVTAAMYTFFNDGNRPLAGSSNFIHDAMVWPSVILLKLPSESKMQPKLQFIVDVINAHQFLKGSNCHSRYSTFRRQFRKCKQSSTCFLGEFLHWKGGGKDSTEEALLRHQHK